jgi:hypothetical protein
MVLVPMRYQGMVGISALLGQPRSFFTGQPGIISDGS